MPLPIPLPVPVPTPQPTPTIQPGTRRHWLPDRQDYAVVQERDRHDSALYAFGEFSMFALMWTIRDHELGLVERCPRCWTSNGKTASVYMQADDAKCPECFGTTYDGGFKALLVRPSLWDANEEDERGGARGEVIMATASVQSTSDFRLRTGDYIFRADGTRWAMRTVSSNDLRTGFAMPSQTTSTVGFNFGTVSRVDESSVAYLIGPTPSEVRTILGVHGVRTPQDFSAHEVIRGPIIERV